MRNKVFKFFIGILLVCGFVCINTNLYVQQSNINFENKIQYNHFSAIGIVSCFISEKADAQLLFSSMKIISDMHEKNQIATQDLENIFRELIDFSIKHNTKKRFIEALTTSINNGYFKKYFDKDVIGKKSDEKLLYILDKCGMPQKFSNDCISWFRNQNYMSAIIDNMNYVSDNIKDLEKFGNYTATLSVSFDGDTTDFSRHIFGYPKDTKLKCLFAKNFDDAIHRECNIFQIKFNTLRRYEFVTHIYEYPDFFYTNDDKNNFYIDNLMYLLIEDNRERSIAFINLTGLVNEINCAFDGDEDTPVLNTYKTELKEIHEIIREYKNLSKEDKDVYRYKYIIKCLETECILNPSGEMKKLMPNFVLLLKLYSDLRKLKTSLWDDWAKLSENDIKIIIRDLEKGISLEQIKKNIKVDIANKNELQNNGIGEEGLRVNIFPPTVRALWLAGNKLKLAKSLEHDAFDVYTIGAIGYILYDQNTDTEYGPFSEIEDTVYGKYYIVSNKKDGVCLYTKKDGEILSGMKKIKYIGVMNGEYLFWVIEENSNDKKKDGNSKKKKKQHINQKKYILGLKNGIRKKYSKKFDSVEEVKIDPRNNLLIIKNSGQNSYYDLLHEDKVVKPYQKKSDKEKQKIPLQVNQNHLSKIYLTQSIDGEWLDEFMGIGYFKIKISDDWFYLYDTKNGVRLDLGAFKDIKVIGVLDNKLYFTVLTRDGWKIFCKGEQIDSFINSQILPARNIEYLEDEFLKIEDREGRLYWFRLSNNSYKEFAGNYKKWLGAYYTKNGIEGFYKSAIDGNICLCSTFDNLNIGLTKFKWSKNIKDIQAMNNSGGRYFAIYLSKAIPYTAKNEIIWRENIYPIYFHGNSKDKFDKVLNKDEKVFLEEENIICVYDLWAQDIINVFLGTNKLEFVDEKRDKFRVWDSINKKYIIRKECMPSMDISEYMTGHVGINGQFHYFIKEDNKKRKSLIEATDDIKISSPIFDVKPYPDGDIKTIDLYQNVPIYFVKDYQEKYIFDARTKVWHFIPYNTDDVKYFNNGYFALQIKGAWYVYDFENLKHDFCGECLEVKEFKKSEYINVKKNVNGKDVWFLYDPKNMRFINLRGANDIVVSGGNNIVFLYDSYVEVLNTPITPVKTSEQKYSPNSKYMQLIEYNYNANVFKFDELLPAFSKTNKEILDFLLAFLEFEALKQLPITSLANILITDEFLEIVKFSDIIIISGNAIVSNLFKQAIVMKMSVDIFIKNFRDFIGIFKKYNGTNNMQFVIKHYLTIFKLICLDSSKANNYLIWILDNFDTRLSNLSNIDIGNKTIMTILSKYRDDIKDSKLLFEKILTLFVIAKELDTNIDEFNYQNLTLEEFIKNFSDFLFGDFFKKINLTKEVKDIWNINTLPDLWYAYNVMSDERRACLRNMIITNTIDFNTIPEVKRYDANLKFHFELYGIKEISQNQDAQVYNFNSETAEKLTGERLNNIFIQIETCCKKVSNENKIKILKDIGKDTTGNFEDKITEYLISDMKLASAKKGRAGKWQDGMNKMSNLSELINRYIYFLEKLNLYIDKQSQSKISSSVKELKTKIPVKYVSQIWDRKPSECLVLGKTANSCIALDRPQKDAVIDYMYDRSIELFRVFEINSDGTKKEMGYIKTFLGLDSNSKSCVVIDSMEIPNQDNEIQISILCGIIEHVKIYAKNIGITNIIIADKLDRRTNRGTKKCLHIEKLGGAIFDKIYLHSYHKEGESGWIKKDKYSRVISNADFSIIQGDISEKEIQPDSWIEALIDKVKNLFGLYRLGKIDMKSIIDLIDNKPEMFMQGVYPEKTRNILWSL
jgi:hypothetical protein